MLNSGPNKFIPDAIDKNDISRAKLSKVTPKKFIETHWCVHFNEKVFVIWAFGSKNEFYYSTNVYGKCRRIQEKKLV